MARFPTLPENTHLADVFKAFPAGVIPLLDYHDIILRQESPLSVAQRELIAALVSGLNGCDFCYGAHAIIAESFGIQPAVFESLMQSIQDAPVDQEMKPLLAYVKKLTQHPSRVTDAHAQAVYDAGWSEQALHDAISVCALFNFMNRIVEGHGVVTNDAVRRAQRERSEKNREQPPSPTFYRDIGRKLGLEPE